jgi:hypothetical protein
MTETIGPAILPLFDLFLDLPHPRASPECPGAFVIPAPSLSPSSPQQQPGSSNNNSSNAFIQQITPHQVTPFAFPEVTTAGPTATTSTTTTTTTSTTRNELNQYDVYAMQTTAAHFTFSWQLADGRRLHGHVRRYLPSHLSARTRYDVGRRGERALVLLTRHGTTTDALFPALLKYVL